MLGDGGARKAAGCGLGARFLAGEKCCCKVENAGLFNCDSAGPALELVVASPAIPRDGGRSVVVELSKVDEDLVRL